MAGEDQRDRAGAEAGDGVVGAACQHDRNPRAEHDSGHFRVGEIDELLGQHVAGIDVGDDEDVGLAGDRRDDPLGLCRLLRNGVIEGERRVEDAAGDLAAIGHLA